MDSFAKFKKGMAERDILIEQFCLTAANRNKFITHKIAIDTGFTLILVGRDGGEKFRSTKLVSATTIFGIVDAMPMRIQEIKNQESSSPKNK